MQIRTFKDLPLDAVKSIATVKFICVLSQIYVLKQNNQHSYYHDNTILLKSHLAKTIGSSNSI